MVAFHTVNYKPNKGAFEVTVTKLIPKPETTYRSYLLRLWQSEESGFVWRAMLENVKEPSQRHYFKDLESLAAFLSTGQEDQPPYTEREV
jgi:hypothetical protein